MLDPQEEDDLFFSRGASVSPIGVSKGVTVSVRGEVLTLGFEGGVGWGEVPVEEEVGLVASTEAYDRVAGSGGTCTPSAVIAVISVLVDIRDRSSSSGRVGGAPVLVCGSSTSICRTTEPVPGAVCAESPVRMVSIDRSSVVCSDRGDSVVTAVR